MLLHILFAMSYAMKRFFRVLESIGSYLQTLLLDVNFNHYISLKIIPVCYLFVLISTAGGLAYLVITGFMASVWEGLILLAIAPMVFLLWVSMCRLVLELLIVVFRITVQLDEMSAMRESLGEVTALTRPLSRLFQSKPVRPVRSSRQDTPPPTNNRR